MGLGIGAIVSVIFLSVAYRVLLILLVGNIADGIADTFTGKKSITNS